MKRTIYYIIILLTLFSCNSTEQINLGNASVQYSNKQIIVSTGQVKRIFNVTTTGILTSEYIDIKSGKNFISPSTELQSDWKFSAVAGDAILESISAEISDDEGFTSKHIEVIAQFNYPEDNLSLKYVIWIYPDAPGLRTQLLMKNITGDAIEDESYENIIEQLAVQEKYNNMMFWGYSDGTQMLNQDSTPIMKTEILKRTKVENDWASGVCLSDSEHGLVMLKESNKCFNSKIVSGNGRIITDSKTIINTGSGFSLNELNNDDYKSSWATWTILFNGNDDDMELKVKQFDRFRFPIDKERDMYMIANTWGSAVTKKGAKLAAREENVLKEIDSQADLGIDIQQIDDGWQGCQTGSDTWRPVDSVSFNPEGDCDELKREYFTIYPSGGWEKVKEQAMKKSIRLGLWVHGGKVTYDDLVWNYENGGFMEIKYDFFSMKTKAESEAHFKKVRDFIRFTNHNVRVNWDVTGSRRIGYYFGRDLGAIYLENRKTIWPEVTTYRPHLVLRDAWQLANYVNLNKFQVTVTNTDLVNKQLSDAYKYSQSYSFAISMMAIPVFFQETQLYSNQARKELKPLIAIYKLHRENIFDSYIFPIGEEPNNASWTGFQAFNPESETGYLTVFRELNSDEKEHTFKLRFIKNKMLVVTNLLTGESFNLNVDNNGEININIDKKADFRFFQYKFL